MVDQDLVTDAVRTLALNTLSAYRSGVSVKWHDAELAIYLVYIFGEINKSKKFIVGMAFSADKWGRWWERASSILPSASGSKRKAKRD